MSEGQAGAIEITPAMVEAVLTEYALFWPGEDSPAKIIREVYRAMAAWSPSKST
jgi:hypothetical protein